MRGALLNYRQDSSSREPSLSSSGNSHLLYTTKKVQEIVQSTIISPWPDRIMQSLQNIHKGNSLALFKLKQITFEPEIINIAGRKISRYDVPVVIGGALGLLLWVRKKMNMPLPFIFDKGQSYFSFDQALIVAWLKHAYVPHLEDWKYLLQSMPSYDYDIRGAYEELRSILNLSRTGVFDKFGRVQQDAHTSAYWISDTVTDSWSIKHCVVKIEKSLSTGIPLDHEDLTSKSPLCLSNDWLYPLRLIFD